MFLFNEFIENNYYNWLVGTFTDLNGINGQGVNNNPESMFNNHQVATINNKIFDPSYGNIFNNISEFQEQALVGFYRITPVAWNEQALNVDLNGNQIIEDKIEIVWTFLVSNDIESGLFYIKPDTNFPVFPIDY